MEAIKEKKKMHKANVGLPNPSIYFSKCANQINHQQKLFKIWGLAILSQC